MPTRGMGTRREAASAAGRLVFALALLALVSTSVCGSAGALKGVHRAAELQGAARRVTVGIVDGAMRLRGGGKKDKAEAKEEAEDGDEKMEDKEPVPRSAMDMPEVQDPNEYEPGDRHAPSSHNGATLPEEGPHQPPRAFPPSPSPPLHFTWRGRKEGTFPQCLRCLPRNGR
jgi:hypothetical protein